MNEAWTRLSLLIAAGLLPISLSAAPHPEASYYADAYSRHYQVPRELVHAIIQQESNWNDRAVSVKGACGLMQLMPHTASRLGVSDTFDMQQNISGGVRYRRWELASRSRLAGAGFKPPGAAALKRRGGERPWKRRPFRALGVC